MIISSNRIAELLDEESNHYSKDDPLIVVPCPDLDALRKSGDSSIDLRLGCWIAILKHSHVSLLDVVRKDLPGGDDASLAKMHYVQFGEKFVLHPGGFVLGVTLEWIKLPKNLAGYVTSRSSWGRRGLIIATATGVHPEFNGCLTLELSNVGEVPIAIYPGMAICQFFMHSVDGRSNDHTNSDKAGRRKPLLGKIKATEDTFFQALIAGKKIETE